MNNMRVRKLSLEMLGWSRDESRFAMEGRLVFAHVTADTNWRAKWKGTVNSGLKLMAANAFIGINSEANVFCFCHHYPPPFKQPRQSLAPTCNLSSLN
jgi:hypothetical protein